MTLTAEQKHWVKYYAWIELARREFWYYCKLTAPDFYKDDRAYLKTICDDLQAFTEDDNNVLIINLPPRFGKSRTACKFVEWLIGHDNTLKIMTASYNETVSTVFSKAVRNTIQELKTVRDKVVYSDIFPKVRIKRGDGASNLWGIEGNTTNSYLATSPTGTATSFGADYLLIDDLIKNDYEAENEQILDNQWKWFTDTIFSRLEGKRKVIIIMTQWAEKDLAHRVQDHFTKIGQKVKTIQMGAVNKDGTMLCDEILDRKAYEAKRATLSANIFQANYNNVMVDMGDRLYDEFKTYKYDELPTFEKIVSRVDSADEGDDYLCKIVAGRKNNMLYILDVLYTQDKMEITEKQCANMDLKNKTNYCIIESNNGGKLFAQNISRVAKDIGNYLTRYTWKATTKNKESRILSTASGVNNVMIMPSDWKTRWPQFNIAITTYMRKGKNKHDDAPDCLTALYEDEFTSMKRGF